METILVGILCLFECLKSDGRYGVFRKTRKSGTRPTTYVIAPVPSIRAYDEPPSSVLREFETEAEALRVFARWQEE
jgi:hypothetical protein